MKPQSSVKKSPVKAPAERVAKDIRRQTRRHFSTEDTIRIVLDGLCGEDSIAELCRLINESQLGAVANGGSARRRSAWWRKK